MLVMKTHYECYSFVYLLKTCTQIYLQSIGNSSFVMLVQFGWKIKILTAKGCYYTGKMTAIDFQIKCLIISPLIVYLWQQIKIEQLNAYLQIDLPKGCLIFKWMTLNGFKWICKCYWYPQKQLPKVNICHVRLIIVGWS